MSELALQKYLNLAYAQAREQQPNVGRRQLKLQTVRQFWQLSKLEKKEAIQEASLAPTTNISPETNSDPFDIPGLAESGAIGTRGLVVRTHFDSADDPAWSTFRSTLEDLERKSLGSIADAQMDEDSESEDEGEDEGKGEKETIEAGPSNEEDTSMAEDDQPSTVSLAYETDAIFVVIDPTSQGPTQTPKDVLSDASNIALLRLFNDAIIVPSPPLMEGAPKRIMHRLIDEDGYQEVYQGARIWVWDRQSAKDQTLRLVSSRAYVYGDATGDSWRAKAAHMWDLQVNMDAGMRIDFSGGMGIGWDLNERTRNLKESVQ
ncbi:hypothetical protein BDV93DRAFT_491993 [Ceratobasidium sp. AG-I]|nr:hypothetical protein BDV93DRAFT_491993 [Ceratobasidium sp. AG-I]